MKARLKLKDKLTSKQKANIEAYAKEINQLEAVNNARRLIKIVCVALNQNPKFRFGHDRLSVLLGEIDNLAEKQKDDPVFWSHIDREIIDYLKLPFEPEDYEKMGE